MFHAPSFECCVILQTLECRGSLLWTVVDKLVILRSSQLKTLQRCLHEMSTTFVRTESCSLAKRCVTTDVFRSFSLEVKMSSSCSPEAKAIQSRVR